MSFSDPDCYPSVGSDTPVCAGCIDDADIQALIVDCDGEPGCAYCEQDDFPTAPLGVVADRVRECIEANYGRAAEQLPYESAEGGYQGRTWNTFEILYDELSFDREGYDGLISDLASEVGDEVWCDFEWTRLDYDQTLRYAWESFCDLIKYRNRFFFANTSKDDEEFHDPDRYDPLRLFHEILSLTVECGLFKPIAKGTTFLRGRARTGEEMHSAASLGPPPANSALQSNRMNPPGIVMMYGSEDVETAIAETRSNTVSLGTFEFLRDVLILDLVDLPHPPGLFSGADREHRLGLHFLHAFAFEIALPIDGSDRTQLDYIPTQVMTEFFRTADLPVGPLDGIRFSSAVCDGGRNIVLFANRKHVCEPDGTAVEVADFDPPEPWIKLVGVAQHPAG